MDVHDHLFGHGFLGFFRPYLQHTLVRHDVPRTGTHRGHLCFLVTLDGRSLGQTHVGHLVGLGCPPDF